MRERRLVDRVLRSRGLPILAFSVLSVHAVPESIWQPAVLLQKRGNETTKQQVGTTGDSAEAYFLVGESYRTGPSTDVEAAAKAYNQAILLKPDYAAAYKGLAWTYWRVEDLNKKIAALEKATALNPNDAEAYYQLGDALITDALTTLDIGRKVPTEDEVKAALEVQKKKARRAVEAYLQAISINPEYADAHNGLEVAYLVLQRPVDALMAIERAISYDPANPSRRISLGYVYLHLRDYEAALSQHRAAMKLIDALPQDGPKIISKLGAHMLLDNIQEMMEER